MMYNYIKKYIFQGQRDTVELGKNNVVSIDFKTKQIKNMRIECALVQVKYLINNEVTVKCFPTKVGDMYETNSTVGTFFGTYKYTAHTFYENDVIVDVIYDHAGENRVRLVHVPEILNKENSIALNNILNKVNFMYI